MLEPMAPFFHASALAGDDVRLALPIIQVTRPGTTMTSWLEFSAYFDIGDENRAGILALRDAADVICGVVAYRIEHGLQEARQFSAHLFTAVDLSNSLRTVQLLLDVITAHARQLQCRSLQIRVDPRQTELADRMPILGMTASGILFGKPVELTVLPQ